MKLAKLVKEYRAGFYESTGTLRAVSRQDHSIDVDHEFYREVRPGEEAEHLILDNQVELEINNVVASFTNMEKLKQAGVSPVRRILISGRPGTGKSSLAELLASKLGLKLILVKTPSLFSSLMGDSSKNIMNVFDDLQKQRAVVLFDEFDSLAISRNTSNELGEMRRIVNTVLTILDSWNGQGLLVATTNDAQRLDDAVWRRFDETIRVPMPLNAQRLALWNDYTRQKLTRTELTIITSVSEGYSPADIENITQQALRDWIIKRVPLFETIVRKVGGKTSETAEREQMARVLKQQNQRLSTREIGEILGVSKSSVQRYLSRQ